MGYNDNVAELEALHIHRIDYEAYMELANADQLDPNAIYMVSGDEIKFDAALNASSENAPQTKVVYTALDNKVDKVSGKVLSTNDYTTTEKNKLAGIAANANKTVIDTTLSTTSENPVQNKVVKSALDLKADITYVDQKVADLVDSAPEALNTLNEFAQALGNDENFATTITTEIGKKASREEVNTALQEINEAIEAIPEQVQADWNVSDTTNSAYIKNKPVFTFNKWTGTAIVDASEVSY